MFFKKTLVYVSCILMIIYMGIYGIQTKKSFINNVDVRNTLSEKNIKVQISSYEPDITNSFIDTDDISSLSDLITESPIIVKVKVKKNMKRELYYFCSTTYVDVLEVYEGSMDNNTTISVFEPIFTFNMENQPYIYSLDGYNYMNEEDEYILFLRKLKDIHYSRYDNIYIPTTTIYSKYNVNDDIKLDAISTPDAIVYDTLKNSDVLLTDNKRIKVFSEIKKTILDDGLFN